jgi:hypothetical protein
MWYVPYLRVRRAVLIYVSIAAGISLTAVALRFWPGVGPVVTHVQGHGHVIMQRSLLVAPAATQAAAQHSSVDLSMLVSAAIALVGGLATVFGLNLAAENDGHLELAWTKPVSREGYALGIFAVDIAAMAVCVVFTALCAAVVVDVYAGYAVVVPSGGDALLDTLAYCGLPLCVYAWITALSASLKRNRGAVSGIFWPLMIALVALRSVSVPAVHNVATALNLFNPIAIFSASGNDPHTALWSYAWGWLVAAVLLATALIQWRRLER